MGVNEDLRTLGRAIRHHRRRKGLSQEALAELAGLHRNYIGFLERGERNPKATTIFAVAKALDVPTTVLFESLT